MAFIPTNAQIISVPDANAIYSSSPNVSLDESSTLSYETITANNTTQQNITQLNASVSSITGTSSSSTIGAFLNPDGSTYQSNQLPAFSGTDINSIDQFSLGTPAASGTSYNAAQEFLNLQTSQNSCTFDDTSVFGAASPIDMETLQSPSNVYNNAFATLSDTPATPINTYSNVNNNSDRWDRVKLRFFPGHPLATYPGILAPLAQTTGLVWLYKPTINISANIDYETMSLTHSIQDIHSFVTNRAPTITVAGSMISQSVNDAMYAIAAIHFLQSVSKMAYGVVGQTSASMSRNTFNFENIQATTIPAGTPPPVLILSGYGSNMLNDLPVVVTNFSLDLPTDVDYIEVPAGYGAGSKIPVSFTLQVTLAVQRSPQSMRAFNLDKFSRYGQAGWW